MPPCPDGKKCICSWNWIHGNKRKQGYGNELYSEFLTSHSFNLLLSCSLVIMLTCLSSYLRLLFIFIWFAVNGFDCTVTNSKSNRPLAKNKAPVDCRDDKSTCVKGAKQALYWQGAVAEGWNVPDPAVPNNPMVSFVFNIIRAVSRHFSDVCLILNRCFFYVCSFYICRSLLLIIANGVLKMVLSKIYSKKRQQRLLPLPLPLHLVHPISLLYKLLKIG